MATFSDTFAGSGALGVTEVGGIAWQEINGTWSRSSGYAATSTAQSSNPMAVIDAGTGQIDMSAAVSSSGGDALYFRVVDGSNWLRARVRRYQVTTTTTEYEWNVPYNHDSSDSHPNGQAINPSPGTVWYLYWSTSQSTVPGPAEHTLAHDHADNPAYSHTHSYNKTNSPKAELTGKTRQVSSTSTYYAVYLDKCVAGTVTQLGSYGGSATSLRVRADGSSVTVYVNGTSRISVTESTHQNAVKHGVGKAASDLYGSAIDNFSLEQLIPPNPTINSPGNNTTVGTGTPTLQATVTAWGTAKTKVEYQVAHDSAFTLGVKTLVEPNEAFRASGSYSLLVTEANLLTQRDWYIRARQVSETGLAGNWTAANFFTVAHPPGAIDLTPTGGVGIIHAATNRLSWKFTDTSATDSQTARHVIVERNDNGAVVLDTGKIANTSQFIDVALDVALKNVQLRWKVKVWDEEDKASSWTNYSLFIPTDAPVVTILEPLDGGSVGTSRPLVRWSFTASGGRSQASHRVTVNLQGSGSLLYDSATISTNADQHEVQSPVIENGKTYEIRVYTTDSMGITVSALSVVSAVYEEPDVVQFDVDDRYYESHGYVRLTWQAENDPTFLKWRIYRRRVGDAAWKLLGEIPQLTVTEYKDWLVPSMTTYDYYVVQVVERFEEEVESVVAAPERIALGTGGYWLIDNVNSSNNLRLHNVVSEDYTLMNEQAEYTIVGRGRHVDEGEEIGRSGTMTCQLRDSGETTAAWKLQTLEGLRKRKQPLYLRNPFGAIIYVALGDVAVSRVAGVGSAEFVDVTVPYLEVL